jgi:hypothetical protein
MVGWWMWGEETKIFETDPIGGHSSENPHELGYRITHEAAETTMAI